MNLPFFFAKRIAIHEKKTFSSFIVRIAIIAITLSVAVMIVGTAITRGYQKEISHKFYDCWGQIYVTHFLPDPNSFLNDDVMDNDTALVNKMQQIPNVKSVNAYRIQSCLLKAKDEIEGVVLKGMMNANGFSSFQEYYTQGRSIQFDSTRYSNDVVISKTISDKQHIQLGDKVLLYFLNKNEFQPKVRKVNICAIYNTGIEDFDKSIILCDAKLINSVNNDSLNIIQGYEIHVYENEKTLETENKIFSSCIEPPLQTYTLEKRFSNVFSWLGMMKMNEKIIIFIMLLIAIINMITALLILILERTQMVGILKSLGMSNLKIQQIFIYSSLFIVTSGILLGTFLGVGLCLLQQHIGFINLDESTYYIKQVPIRLELSTIVWIDVGTILICLVLLLLPSYIIRTISPTKALRFN